MKRPRIYGKKIEIESWATALQSSHLPTLQACLEDAVESEQYELAAQARDRISEVIASQTGPYIETIEPPY